MVAVSSSGVTIPVDGRMIVNWTGGASERLWLSDYWATAQKTSLFPGAYDCRYRFHRIPLETVSGSGTVLTDKLGLLKAGETHCSNGVIDGRLPRRTILKQHFSRQNGRPKQPSPASTKSSEVQRNTFGREERILAAC